MTSATTLREALFVEALGETANLIQQVEALAPMLEERCSAFVRADTHLQDSLAGFETRMAAITENAKRQTVQYLATKVDEGAQRSVEQQSRAMRDAARMALSAELGAAMEQRDTALRTWIEQRNGPWERWLMPLVAIMAASAASAATWLVAMSWARDGMRLS